MSSNLAELIELLPRTYKLCVSDFDGVQGFTERLQMEAYVKIIERHAGITLNLMELARDLIGKTAIDNLTALKEKFKFAPEVSVLVEEREKIYIESVFEKELQPNQFMIDICRNFSLNGELKPIIVSNSSQGLIQDILDYWGTRGFFGMIYGIDTFPNIGTPLPNRKIDFILNHLPRLYDLPPNQIIVFEDSVGTSQKVEKSGMGVGFIRHMFNEDFHPQTSIVLQCASLKGS